MLHIPSTTWPILVRMGCTFEAQSEAGGARYAISVRGMEGLAGRGIFHTKAAEDVIYRGQRGRTKCNPRIEPKNFIPRSCEIGIGSGVAEPWSIQPCATLPLLDCDFVSLLLISRLHQTRFNHPPASSTLRSSTCINHV